MAKLLARQAEDDPGVTDAASAALTKFKTEHKDAWQLFLCNELLAKLQMDKKDYAGAQRTYEDLAKTPGISDDAKQEANIKIAQVLVQAKKYAEAEQRLVELVKTVKPDSPQGVRLQLALAESQAAADPEKALAAAKQLENVLEKIPDADLKASAYNTLGDCYQKADRKKDALWDYLWVDVVYFQNRHEHARALYHLRKLFKDLKDEKRAKEFEDKLKGSQFAGLEYQKMLLNEK
jgi:tetratricopeptide (TPR) repeat protein